ncbi:MAG TPA: UDP binding domain-containing protein, partial [Gaiellaceae bacterium]|nr:UDP binding domain-containing protein [Gaiellaceae bacterium]
FIELAGKVNENMPYYCRSVIAESLDRRCGIALSRARVQVLGVAYKAGVADVRESPALKLISLLQEAGAEVAYHDPYVAEIEELELVSRPLEPEAYDAVVIVTAHPDVDYERLIDRARLVVDFRNATGEAGRLADNVRKL